LKASDAACTALSTSSVSPSAISSIVSPVRGSTTGSLLPLVPSTNWLLIKSCRYAVHICFNAKRTLNTTAALYHLFRQSLRCSARCSILVFCNLICTRYPTSVGYTCIQNKAGSQSTVLSTEQSSFTAAAAVQAGTARPKPDHLWPESTWRVSLFPGSAE